VAKKNHYVTGFCLVGAHEGMRPKFSGVPAKTCENWAGYHDPQYGDIPACTCKCHVEITEMYNITGLERITADNPEYRTPRSPYYMPDPLEISRRSSSVLADDDGPVQSARPAIVSPVLPMLPAPSRPPTPTGKRARGQLEDEVLRVCGAFVRGELEHEILTPAAIAREIDEVEPPSVGAIGAVFDRWVKIGFARCEKGPVRFEAFTLEGAEKGLEYMKSKVKREKRIGVVAQGRTLRPLG